MLSSLLSEKSWWKCFVIENLPRTSRYLKEQVCPTDHIFCYYQVRLVNNIVVCLWFQTAYRFSMTELAKLDKTERRYAWIKRRLRTNEEIWKIFPRSWHVDYLLCIQFCKLTRLDIWFLFTLFFRMPEESMITSVILSISGV